MVTRVNSLLSSSYHFGLLHGEEFLLQIDVANLQLGLLLEVVDDERVVRDRDLPRRVVFALRQAYLFCLLLLLDRAWKDLFGQGLWNCAQTFLLLPGTETYNGQLLSCQSCIFSFSVLLPLLRFGMIGKVHVFSELARIVVILILVNLLHVLEQKGVSLFVLPQALHVDLFVLR